MTRRKFLDIASQQAVAVAGASVLGTRARANDASSSKKRDQRPNIVLIMADDLGFSDLGCYGGEINTPHLDRLANNGLRFTQFYNNSLCTPTRASLLTGLYPQQVSRATRERRIPHCVSIADVLKGAGYNTLMTGKWHNGSCPVRMGFDRYYGMVSGACNFFNPGKRRKGENEPGRKMPNEMRPWMRDGTLMCPYTPEDPDFYTTDAFSDQAVDYLDQYGKDSKPFFLYMAYTAPHFPLQALPEDIAKYRGKYLVGWDKIRQQRYERLLKSGIITPDWKFPERDSIVPAWDDVSKKDAHDLTMAVYAAMIDRMDQGIGRVMSKIKELGVEDNTLVMFLSDNGSCSSIHHATPNIAPGPMESYRTLDPPWANASNSPFRRYKTWIHEGGISTPFIAYWPRMITQSKRGISHQVGHVIDIMPTIVELSEAEYPKECKGQSVPPAMGKSLVPILNGEQRQEHDALFWNLDARRKEDYWGFPAYGVRMGKWKLVAAKNKGWELYDLEADRTETENVALKHPAKARELASRYREWTRSMT